MVVSGHKTCRFIIFFFRFHFSYHNFCNSIVFVPHSIVSRVLCKIIYVRVYWNFFYLFEIVRKYFLSKEEIIKKKIERVWLRLILNENSKMRPLQSDKDNNISFKWMSKYIHIHHMSKRNDPWPRNKKWTNFTKPYKGTQNNRTEKKKIFFSADSKTIQWKLNIF